MSIKKSAEILFSARHFWLFLSLVFLVSFGYSLVHQIKSSVDARAYNEIAKNIIDVGEYRLSIGSLLEKDDAIVKVGPGYEFFLAGIYSVFGYKYWVVWALQSLMFVFSLVFLAVLIVSLFGGGENFKWRAFYCVFIPAAFFIDVIQLNAMLLSESLFIFLSVVSLFFFYWSLENKKWWKEIILGVTLGLLYLVRPVALVILFAFLTAFILKKYYRSLILVLAIFSVMQVPWVLRNYNVYGKILLTHTTAGGVDLLSGNYPGNYGEYRSDFDLYKKIEEKDPTPIGFYENSIKWFLNFTKDNPFSLLTVWIEKGIIFWSLTKTGGFWFHYFNNFEQLFTVLFSVASYVLIFGTALIYSLKIIKKKFREGVFFEAVFLALVLLMMVSVVTIVSSRYRLTLFPFAVILSAGYWFEKEKFDYRYYIITGGWLVFATIFDLMLQYDKFLYKIGLLLS